MIGTSFVYISPCKTKKQGYVSLFSDYRWPLVKVAKFEHGFELFKLKLQTWRIFSEISTQIMTESQPEGSETTRDAMKEDLIEENALEVEETDQFTQRAIAKSFTSVNKRKAPASQSKGTRRRRSFLAQRGKWKLC